MGRGKGRRKGGILRRGRGNREEGRVDSDERRGE